MAIIVDRRLLGSGGSANNRQKFIKRYKDKLKGIVDRVGRVKSLKDVLDSTTISINKKDLEEPTFGHDQRTGTKSHILPGNRNLIKGDVLRKPVKGGGGGNGTTKGDDSFWFTLTKEEFIDIYFKNMKLPSFVKKSLAHSSEYKYKRSGYTKEGTPSKLNIKKTMENAIARRIATKAQGKKPRYLDDVDVRYNNHVKVTIPIKKAVMICVMDVSASMGEMHKIIAKKFFLLLYLFLHKEYQDVELVFIRHTHEANECSEKEFFYGTDTGSTIISSALILANSIIEARYKLSETNIYLAQASDGDNYLGDAFLCEEVLHRDLLDKLQYMAYIEVNTESTKPSTTMKVYKSIQKVNPKLNTAQVQTEADVYPALQSLFQKDQ